MIICDARMVIYRRLHFSSVFRFQHVVTLLK